MKALKECPICGKQGAYAACRKGYWFVYCKDPACARVGACRTRGQAINLWNTRGGEKDDKFGWE